jgi:hypothetical protein
MPSAPIVHRSRSTGWRFVVIAVVALGVFMLCASVLVATTSRSGSVTEISASAEPTMQGAKVSIRGKGWPVRTAIALSASAPPGATAELDFGTVQTDAQGEFRATKLSKCTTRTPTDTSTWVHVKAQAGEARATTRISAAAWLCMTS